MSDAAVGFETPVVEMPVGNNGRTTEGRFARGNAWAIRPGETRNKAGRPPKPLTEALWAGLQRIIPHDAAGELLRAKLHLRKNARWIDALAMSLIMRAVTDNDAAIEVINRLEGKPVSPIELSTPTAVTFHVVYDDERAPKE